MCSAIISGVTEYQLSLSNNIPIFNLKKPFGAFLKGISSPYRYFSMGGKGGQHS